VSSKFPAQATLVVKLQEFGSAKEGEVSRIMEISSEKKAKGSCLASLVLAVTMGYYGAFESVYVHSFCWLHSRMPNPYFEII